MRKRLSFQELIERGMRNAVEVGDCLEWTGPYACRGTTPVAKGRKPGGKTTINVPVCRTIWELAHGPVASGKMVYRICCNNACVKLEHLVAGTRKQWAANRKKNGLTKHSPDVKLHISLGTRKRPNIVNSMEKARQVRALDGTMSRKLIAAVTGVSPDMVTDICANRAWVEHSDPFAGLFR